MAVDNMIVLRKKLRNDPFWPLTLNLTFTLTFMDFRNKYIFFFFFFFPKYNDQIKIFIDIHPLQWDLISSFPFVSVIYPFSMLLVAMGTIMEQKICLNHFLQQKYFQHFQSNLNTMHKNCVFPYISFRNSYFTNRKKIWWHISYLLSGTYSISLVAMTTLKCQHGHKTVVNRKGYYNFLFFHGFPLFDGSGYSGNQKNLRKLGFFRWHPIISVHY